MDRDELVRSTILIVVLVAIAVLIAQSLRVRNPRIFLGALRIPQGNWSQVI
jgi:hypothetical protein